MNQPRQNRSYNQSVKDSIKNIKHASAQNMNEKSYNQYVQQQLQRHKFQNDTKKKYEITRRKAAEYIKKCEENCKWKARRKLNQNQKTEKKQENISMCNNTYQNLKIELKRSLKVSEQMNNQKYEGVYNVKKRLDGYGQISRKNDRNTVTINKKVCINERDRKQQTYPCSFCNEEKTLDDMQKHHKICPMVFKCHQCYDLFPIYLKDEHINICKAPYKQKLQKKSPYYPTHNQEQIETYNEMIIQRFPSLDKQQISDIIAGDLLKQSYEKRKSQQFYQQEQFYDSDDFQSENYYNMFSYSSSNNTHKNFRLKEDKKVAGLSLKQINRLATDSYKSGYNKQQTDCAICGSEKQEGQLVVRLPCFHTFHSQCIVPWLQMKPICPKCKFNVRSK